MAVDTEDEYVCRVCGRRARTTAGARCPTDRSVLVEAYALQKNADDPLLGRILCEKYAIVGYVGEGGFGAVYRAIQEPIGQIVAIKVVRDAVRDRPNQLKRFAREARAVAALQHHNTVRLFDFGRDREQLFMVLEYIDGRSLKQVIHSDGHLAPTRAVRIIRQIAESLQEAHGIGVVHRDLKPANIMLTRSPFGDEMVKVLDFGLAKLLNDAVDTGLTARGHAVGSPAYMAPEQIAGTVKTQSDLYALGVVLFEMLMGKKPFEARDRKRLIMAHLNSPIPALPGVPVGLAAVVHRAMAKRPEHRYADAAEMASALDAAMLCAPDADDEKTIATTWPDDWRATTVHAITSSQEPATRVLPRYDDHSLMTSTRRRLWPWLAAAGLLSVGIGLGLALRDESPPAAPRAPARATPVLPLPEPVRAKATQPLTGAPQDAKRAKFGD
ncbi:MAG: serine/threonine protein kinase [Bradymonadia bacterium]